HIVDASVRPARESLARLESVPATPVQSVDDAAIRALVQKMITAYQQKDSQQLFSLFSADSPNLLTLKMELESGWAYHEILERKNLAIRDINVSGDQASVRVAYELPETNGTSTGEQGSGEHFFALELARERDKWKLWNFFTNAVVLAEQLVTAESDEERERLL